MVTARGWWFLMVVLLVLAAGVLLPRQGFVLAALGLTLLGWFLWEWLAFAVRVRSSLHRVRLRRRLRSANRDVTLVWAGREFEVSVDVALPRGLPLPYVVVEDRPPLGGALPSGEYRAAAALPPGEPVRLRYHLLCPEPGVVRFEGVRLDVADYQGFFHQRVFLRRPEEYVVLPPLVDVEGRQRTDKYHNLLLPPGVHRLRRPGTGSELLDLRDYRPGDPPKMIAWKPSARRDRLITKEFESEVPIRCTLFLDASQSVRVGPPGRNPLARLVAIGAAVSQAAAAQRDLVGLTVFDEDRVELVRPARGSRHLIDVMVRLSRAARLAPVSSAPDPPALTRAGLLLAGELYPDLLTPERNRLPWRMFWRPLLDSRWGWLVPLLMASSLLLLLWPAARDAAITLAAVLAPSRAVAFPTFLLICGSPFLLGLLVWLGYGLRGFFNPLHLRLARRKRLAAVVAHVNRLGPGGTALLCEDDEAFGRETQRFLAAHQVWPPVALYDAGGRYLFRSAGKVEVLAAALLRSVARAHDNELFVIMADLFELGDDLDPLLRAVRVALARHHQVLVISPWLTGVPPPGDEESLEAPGGGAAAPGGVPRSPPRDLARAAAAESVAAYRRAYARVRHAFGRIGVSVVRAGEGDPVKLILERLDRLRGVARRR